MYDSTDVFKMVEQREDIKDKIIDLQVECKSIEYEIITALIDSRNIHLLTVNYSAIKRAKRHGDDLHTVEKKKRR